MNERDETRTPEELAAFEAAVQAHAAWLLACADERKLREAFEQQPTPRAAEDLARATFAVHDALNAADEAENEWVTARRVGESRRAAAELAQVLTEARTPGGASVLVDRVAAGARIRAEVSGGALTGGVRGPWRRETVNEKPVEEPPSSVENTPRFGPEWGPLPPEGYTLTNNVEQWTHNCDFECCVLCHPKRSAPIGEDDTG